jgi:hypothetical protein
VDEEKLAELIGKQLDKALNGRRAISDDDHRDHHAFVGILIEERRRRKQRWDAIRVHVLGWGIVTIILGLITALGQWAMHILEQIMKSGGG